MSMEKRRTLAIIGTGKMGTAILSGIFASRKAATPDAEERPITNFIACVQTPSSASRLQTTFAAHLDHLTILQSNNLRAFQDADIVLLACKPYVAQSILSAPGTADALKGKLLISVLAGCPPSVLKEYIYGQASTFSDGAGPERCYITRATPNLAARLASSITLIELASPPLPADLSLLTTRIFSLLGPVHFLPTALFDVGSAVAGAGIAFMTVAVDGLLDGAVAEGMKRSEAMELVAGMLRGCAELLGNGGHPAVLREEIASPKGTTIRGLMELERGGVRGAFGRAVIEASERAREL